VTGQYISAAQDLVGRLLENRDLPLLMFADLIVAWFVPIL